MLNLSVLLVQEQGFSIKSLLPFLAMIVVLYFFMIRPQVKRQKKEKSFQETLKKGQKVVTNSGIHGKVVEVKESTIVLETGAGKITFEKAVISVEMSKKYSQK